MGSAGDSPAPVGDPPTGTSLDAPSKRLSSFAGDALPVPSGESPDGTGQWPVLPKTQSPHTLLATLGPRNDRFVVPDARFSLVSLVSLVWR